MKKLIISSIIAIATLSTLSANDTLINVKSEHNVQETVNNFIKIAKSKGITIFANINHSQGARSINKTLRDTQLVIFGNPKVGTSLMQVKQTVGLDLPLKALFWEDKHGTTWITYRKPKLLIVSHGITSRNKIANKLTKVLAMFSKKAAH